MSSPPTLLLSFDCEGRWGMADQPENPLLPSITHRSLLDTYRRLIDLLDELGLPATFAVVGAFLGDRDEFESRRAAFEESSEHREWMAHVDFGLRRGSDGWFLPELRGMLRERDRLELATHGYTHLPFDSPGVTRAGRRLELAAGIEAAGDLRITTIVYPRNAVIDVDLLGEFGLLGYREAAPTVRQGRLGRLIRVADEFLGRPRSLPHPSVAPPIAIPAGRLLHWRHGVRRIVPVGRTISYWQGVVEDAIRRGGVAHMWLHPHNLITGRRQFELLEHTLRAIVRFGDGGLSYQTQETYVTSLLRSAHD